MYVHVQTYFLSQLRKMLILLCWQCTYFTMGPNEQNQHFAELRHYVFIHTRSSAPNMFAKFGWKTRTFCHKKVAKVIAKLESDRL